MKLHRYELKAGKTLTTFEFFSEGPKGKLIKTIEFQNMNHPHLYNLAFGDKNIIDGQMDDLAITGNRDAEKVLATVVFSIYVFTDRYTEAWIHAKGSSRARTRLYRMGLNKYFEIVTEDFEIVGEYLNEWEWYEKGKDYQAFAVKRKFR